MRPLGQTGGDLYSVGMTIPVLRSHDPLPPHSFEKAVGQLHESYVKMGWKIISSKTITFGGRSAYQLEMLNPLNIQGYYVFIKTDKDMLWGLMFDAPANEFKVYRPLFDRIIKSMRIAG